MLIDVKFSLRDPQMALILGVIAEHGPLIPSRISKGLYRCGHWSIDMLLPKGSLASSWGDDRTLPQEIPSSGVCDYPEQVCEKFNPDALPGHYFVSFVRMLKKDQPSYGGWRWHKWGEYIGTKNPQYEYLYDEPDIEEVYTYHIYDVKPEFRGQIEEPAQSAGDTGTAEQTPSA